MSEDTKFQRIAPKNMRGYLSDFKRSIGVYTWIWKNMADEKAKQIVRRKFIPLAICAVVVGTAQPLILSFVLDGLISKVVSVSIIALIIYGVSLYIERTLMYHQQVAREWILGLNYGSVDKKITELLFEKSMGQHLQENSTLNISNIDKGKWRTLDVQAMLLFEGISAIATLAFTYIGIWIISWIAGLIMTVVVVIYVAWSLYINKRVMQEILPVDRELRALNRYRYERWEKTERVKVSGRVVDEIDYMAKRFDDVIEKDRNFWIWVIKQARRRSSVRDIGVVLTMIVGVWLVYTGAWTVGLLYPLFAWTGQFRNNLWRVGEVEHQLNWHMPAIQSMIDAVTLPVQEVENANAISIPKSEPLRIEFENVFYAYPTDNPALSKERLVPHYQALQNINFTIEPGQKVALIGDSGAGKTTVMRLLLRYQNPDSGCITADGVDIKDISFNSWTECLAYIPQDAQIFDGTIRSNILYALSSKQKLSISEDELWSLMQKFKVDFRDFAFREDRGLETMVGRGGIKLSGGEAQRVMIVAAAVKRPKLMIIDEATSSLDSTNEKEIQIALKEFLGDKISVLIIAHRLNTVRRLCDKFIVLRSPLEAQKAGGNQIESTASSFEELYEVSQTFRRLANDQGLTI